MKKLQYLLVCILIFTIVACSSKNNDITNPISNANLNDNNGNNAKIITTSYTIHGIDEKYNGSWKFFNADDKGNIPVDITIKDGGVSGLVISNGKSENTISFTKEHIYSTPTPEENQYYDRYFGYIISEGTWVGEIHFPTYDDETVGYVYVTNKSTSEIIIGMIDKAPGPKDIFETSFQGEYKSGNRTLKIERVFITYYEDSQVKVKIPASFFELSRDDKNYLGYTVFYGPLYSGVFINTHNTKISDPVNELNFIYVDYNNKLEIQLKEDGTPISAKYNKKTTTISPDNLIYTRQ
ncbi:hypothetical protein [Brachyspira pilosicoli]|uniref:hypothetical protein n=1 Tax=Brachyspira pilosicoli TaxID=52584 RepID=UPI0025438C46|nr:hypothetical protein [Brachyspira pilosicoli]WIH87363.1 hypothetical protein NEI05_07665 [Brachyspira pilosicoli]